MENNIKFPLKIELSDFEQSNCSSPPEFVFICLFLLVYKRKKLRKNSGCNENKKAIIL